jgi:aminoglycoside phosphotransferase (APT) family kinase protein
MKLDKVIAKRTNKTVYRDGNLAIKVFSNDYSKADILNEACNQARVEDCGLNIPRIREVCKIDGKWAIATEFVEGETLAALMEKNPKKMDEYLDTFVRLQMEIHSKRVHNLNKLKDKLNRKISETDLDATTRYELHTRLDGLPVHNKVCHGDYNPSNIIVTPDKELYILDWAHVTQGNASADVARTYLLFSLAAQTEIADRYLDLFCHLSDTAKQYVQKWMPIVAASQSVKGNAKEREFLLKWVDVVDYE